MLTAVTLYLVWGGISANWHFTTDDAFITLRYARHLHEGHGVVWNLHDARPVEGYSNYLFVLLGAAAMALGASPILVLKICGVVGLLGTLGGTWLVARTYVSPIAAFFPGFLILAYPGETYWAASGLETAVFQALVVTGFAALLRESTRARIAACILTFLACLARPDGLVAAALFAAYLLARARNDKRTWLVVGCAFAAPLAAYEIWRVAHFGALLPHSFACKRTFAGDAWLLVRDFAKLAWPLFLVALARRPRDFDARDIVLLGAPLTYLVLLHGVDPLIGQNNRHALLAYALLAIAASANLVRLVRLLTKDKLTLIADSVVALALGVFALSELAAARMDAIFVARNYEERMQARAMLADWLAARARPDDAIVVGDAGLVPYEVHAEFIDAYCLNCLAMTSPAVSRSPERFAEWMFAQHPRFIVVNSATPDVRGVHGFYGVYPAIVKNEAFRDRYTEQATFGAIGDDFQFVVFETKE